MAVTKQQEPALAWDVGAQTAGIWRPFIRAIGPLGIGFLCLWLLSKLLSPAALTGLWPAITGLSATQWFGAVVATAISFWSVGRYDRVMHRVLRTGCASDQASKSGAAAVAIAQTLGFGIFTGALVRWRLLPGLSMRQSLAIAAGVSMTFFAGLALCLGIAGLIFRIDAIPIFLCAMMIITFFIIVVLSILQSSIKILGRRVSLPGPLALGSMAGWAALDTICAALALWLLLPASVDLAFGLLIPAYMLALAAALFSGTPGGVGPFELVLLTVLPDVADADLLCALVAFRVVYYALPAIIAAVLLIRPFPPMDRARPSFRRATAADLHHATRSEAGLALQERVELLQNKGMQAPVARVGHSLCMFFGPLSGKPSATFSALHHAAQEEMRTPFIYKADKRLAAHARGRGWSALHVADDWLIDAKTFQTAGRSFRQLRRKLRHADEQGVEICLATAPPWDRLRQIDRAWQDRKGGARGLTMGQFCPHYLGHQAVFLARCNSHVIGFASFHRNHDGLCLDLMRTADRAPDGTMHALIVHVLRYAQQTGLSTVSLAALPPQTGPLAHAAQWFGADGLRQFKMCFAPRRVPRYALSPNRISLAAGLLDLWRARRRTCNLAQEDHEDYGFARAREV